MFMKQESYKFHHTARNFESSQEVIKVLMPFFKGLTSILDLGGGVGAWSSAFHEAGYPEPTLIDHPGVDRDRLLIKDKRNFLAFDLEKQLPPVNKYDLAVCIEVLEHFSANRALQIHDYLCNCSNLILFSAAIPGQGGVGHQNCRRHYYWHEQFAEKGFAFFDGFKPLLISNDKIHYWIRQNLFIYYKPDQAHRLNGIPNITTTEFEIIYRDIISRKMGIREYLKMAPGVFLKRQKWG